ncbi:polysaccharide deacetylase family protein [Sorangium sp. So ce887]|jgi:peptidoglycan/xylan/chitin deacetylase (PgdA/CDA1 family)|uniref:polysaccharide deacetylase family protein n=1 Tax=Sorangium sp. So ce887 TaxID=3133324 RepID=UPI003F5F84B4
MPRGRRALAAGVLDTLGLLDRFLWLRAKLRLPVLSVFTYHRIAELSDVDELDPGVAEVSAREFEEQLAVIKAHCTVVSLRDVRLFAKGRKLPPNPVMVAFDDGYRDNHDVALPLLQRAGVAATFFIATEYPDRGRLFWWDRVALLMHRCRRARVEIAYPTTLVLEPLRDPIAAATRVCQTFKRTSGVDIGRLWDEIERATGVSIDLCEERALAARTIMDWNQIAALRRAGMDVQSHSHSHRVLQTLSPDEATRDLARSRRVLSEALNEAVHAVAYPVGYSLCGAFHRAVKEAGFEIGFTNNSGLCMLSSFDPLNFPRIAMDRGQIGALFKLKLLIGQRPGSRAGR